MNRCRKVLSLDWDQPALAELRKHLIAAREVFGDGVVLEAVWLNGELIAGKDKLEGCCILQVDDKLLAALAYQPKKKPR